MVNDADQNVGSKGLGHDELATRYEHRPKPKLKSGSDLNQFWGHKLRFVNCSPCRMCMEIELGWFGQGFWLRGSVWGLFQGLPVCKPCSELGFLGLCPCPPEHEQHQPYSGPSRYDLPLSTVISLPGIFDQLDCKLDGLFRAGSHQVP